MRTEDESNLAEAVTRLSTDVEKYKTRSRLWCWLAIWFALVSLVNLYVGHRGGKSAPVEIVCLKELPPPQPCTDFIQQDYGMFSAKCPHPDQRLTFTPGNGTHWLITCTCPRSK